VFFVIIPFISGLGTWSIAINLGMTFKSAFEFALHFEQSLIYYRFWLLYAFRRAQKSTSIAGACIISDTIPKRFLICFEQSLNHLKLGSLSFGIPTSINLGPPRNIRRRVIIKISPEIWLPLLKESRNTLFLVAISKVSKAQASLSSSRNGITYGAANI
jgi:hypothetical protein